MLLIILCLLQVVNAVFVGIPIQSGKIKVVNGSYGSSSTLSGLLYSNSERLALDIRQKTTCPAGYRMCFGIYIKQVQTNVMFDFQAIPCPDDLYCCTTSNSKCVGTVAPPGMVCYTHLPNKQCGDGSCCPADSNVSATIH
jgi:hypothetical protein